MTQHVITLYYPHGVVNFEEDDSAQAASTMAFLSRYVATGSRLTVTARNSTTVYSLATVTQATCAPALPRIALEAAQEALRAQEEEES